jgi:hypothetical protein
VQSWLTSIKERVFGVSGDAGQVQSNRRIEDVANYVSDGVFDRLLENISQMTTIL